MSFSLLLFIALVACIGFIIVLQKRLNISNQQNTQLQKEYDEINQKYISSELIVQSLNNTVNDYKEHIQILENNNSEYKSKIDILEKYQAIIDIEQHINQLKQKAQHELEQEKQQIETYKQDTIQYAESFKEQIHNKVDELKVFLEQHKAKRIQQADNEAQKLYKEYYDDYQSVLQLKELKRALENKIDGYSDVFILPTQTMLDELIDTYSYIDAAQHLKTVKANIQIAVKNKLSAECDYVETNRKETAMEFITNAFNGRADVYVSRLRHDNVGKLIQALRDDFILLNNYGQAFRNARITLSYLNLRIEELKWGAIVLEYREKEREEQRAIREQIKEEEKARREYEKAIKEAEKEERLLKQAYEKARQEFEKASDEQKVKHNEKMQALMEKLKEAEEKNQRALSMAQQTRAGHVYVISNIGSFGDNVLKLGMTRRLDPMDRVRELGDASVPFTFDVHAMIYSDDAPALEKQLHQHFNHYRVNKVNYKKEFFHVSLSDVKNYLDDIGVQAHFTMKAEALQYRETLQIEQMSDDEQLELEQHLNKINDLEYDNEDD